MANNLNRIEGNTAHIYTDKGDKIIIDAEDYEKVAHLKWFVNKCGSAQTNKIVRRRSLMHRIIIKAKCNEKILHRNGNKLDNRKCNLRIVPKSVILSRTA